MVPHLPKPGLVLDVGCHTGWFCRAFQRLGWTAIGIDRSLEWIAAARELDPKSSYAVFDVETESARAMVLKPLFDVVLCFSVAMYFKECYVTLRKLSWTAPRMFFDFGGQYAGSLPFGESDAIPAILEHTHYKEGTLIGRSAIDRPLYLFTR
jgi:SAM-dependent methyltransferase